MAATLPPRLLARNRQGKSHAYERQLKDGVPRQSSGQVIFAPLEPNGARGQSRFRWPTGSPPRTSREPMSVYYFLVSEGQNGKFGLKTFIGYRGNLAMRAMPIVLGTLLMAVGCLPVAAPNAASAKDG